MVIVQATLPFLSKRQLLPPMLHRPPHPLQNPVDGLEVELFSMKLPTSPTTEMADFLMSRLEDDLQEFLIA
jgi:hypothetical protein